MLFVTQKAKMGQYVSAHGLRCLSAQQHIACQVTLIHNIGDSTVNFTIDVTGWSAVMLPALHVRTGNKVLSTTVFYNLC